MQQSVVAQHTEPTTITSSIPSFFHYSLLCFRRWYQGYKEQLVFLRRHGPCSFDDDVVVVMNMNVIILYIAWKNYGKRRMLLLLLLLLWSVRTRIVNDGWNRRKLAAYGMKGMLQVFPMDEMKHGERLELVRVMFCDSCKALVGIKEGSSHVGYGLWQHMIEWHENVSTSYGSSFTMQARP